MTRNFTFSGHFWEHSGDNGVVTLVSRMRMGKQTCERLKAAFEIRVIAEQQYADNLFRMADNMQGCEETGHLAQVLETTQHQWTHLANIHQQNAQDLNTKVIQPLSNLLSKQKQLRRELQASMTKLFNNRQLQIHCVLLARDRYNAECTKANEIMQQSSGKEKHFSYKRVSAVIKKYQQAYDDAMADLEMVTEEWNKQWQYTCQEFELLEEERLRFLQSNIDDGNDLFLNTSCTSEEAYQKIEDAVGMMDVDADLDDFVQTKGGKTDIPSAMDYIKMFVIQEQDKSKDEDDIEDAPVMDSHALEKFDTDHARLVDQEERPVNDTSLMVGRIEIYNSDDETDSEDYSDFDFDDLNESTNDTTGPSQQHSFQHHDDDHDPLYQPEEYIGTSDGYWEYNHHSLQDDDTQDTLTNDINNTHHSSNLPDDEDKTQEWEATDYDTPLICSEGDRIDDLQISNPNDDTKPTHLDTSQRLSDNAEKPDCHNSPPPPPPVHQFYPEDSSYQVNEELETMLRQLEQQKEATPISKPLGGRPRLSGVRQRTPKPRQTLLKALAGVHHDDQAPSTIVAGSEERTALDFFDPFSSLASVATNDHQQKWRLQEVTHALQHQTARRPLPERPGRK
ncbi:hypothetical protein BC941DRAFT_437076 [Chlamydoabsidia padenii]|nr:hypothetical protein BC941DRAFT_437076 [Chlamydoabsidia padenii]